MNENLINFPEDRTLTRGSDESCEASLVLPFGVHPGSFIPDEVHTAKAIAFAVIYIFYRMMEIKELCIKTRLRDESKGDTTCNKDGQTSDENKYIYMKANFSNKEGLRNIFEKIEVVSDRPNELPEVNINIIQGGDDDYSENKLCELENLLNYRIENNLIKLKFIYSKNSIADVTARDFIEKISVVISKLNEKTDLSRYQVSLVTPTASKVMPNLGIEINQEYFKSVPEKFFEMAEKYPTQPAIAGPIYEYSYDYLQKYTKNIMNALLETGVCQGDVVSVSGSSSLGTVASILAVMAVGGIVVIIDDLLPEDRKKLIEKISHPKFKIKVAAVEKIKLSELKSIGVIDWPQKNIVPSMVLKCSPAVASDCTSAYIFFTSGSSGLPKGVLGSRQGLAHFLNWQRSHYPIGPGDKTAQLTALSFDVVLRDLFYPLTGGACIQIPEREIILDARRMLEWIKIKKITVMHCVPSLMKAWLLADKGDKPFKSLKYIFFAGEPLTNSLLHRFRVASSEETLITNLYGPTETTLAKLYNKISKIEIGVQPIGNPQPGVDVVIMNDRETICGLWETGEIAIRTPYRSKGYFENIDLTRQAFEKNKWRDDENDLIYFTGDLGRYRSDGKVEIFGRIDSQIKIRGVRIEPSEIESCILSFTGIKDAAITTRTGPTGDKLLLAVVVPESFENFDEVARSGTLRAVLKTKLQEAMVPARIIFTEKLPYLPNGKLDRKSIGHLDFSEVDKVDSLYSARLQLSEKMRKVIDVIEETIGINVDNLNQSFVDLGGDSLSFIRVSVAIEDEFGTLPLKWEEIPLNVLESNMMKRKIGHQNELGHQWVSMDLSVVLRAIAIIFVVLGHATSFDLIGTSTLFVVSGVSFGKFLQRDLLDDGKLTPAMKFILKFGIPAGLWEVLAVATKSHNYWLPDFILMGTYFHNPNAVYFTLWYLDVLAANVLAMSLILVIVGKLFYKNEGSNSVFAIDLILLFAGLIVSFFQVGMGWWDGALGETSVGPFKWFWILAFGVSITQANNFREKMVLTFMLALLGIAKIADVPMIAGSFALLDSFFFASAMSLIWLSRISVPRILRRLIISIASASLFIYIVNYTVLQKINRLLNNEDYWLVGVTSAVVVGIIFSVIWNKLEILAKTSVILLKDKYAPGS